MKKITIIAIVVALVAAGGVYFVLHKNSDNVPTTQTKTDISTWKIYQNKEFGFSIKYPPQYVVKEDIVATGTPWGSRGLLTISRFEDKSPQTMAPKFHVVSVQVTLQRQPVVASGQVFHTIVEFQKSGYPDLVVQGVPDPVGKLVIVNGVQALAYHTLPGDVVEVPGDIYFFIKDNLVYEFSFDASDPNEKTMLESIIWQ